MTYSVLYTAWGALFALTAVLGFVPVAEGWTGILTAVACAFFLPPWAILWKSVKSGKSGHIRLVRWLSIASVFSTVIMLVLNILSAGWSESAGLALYAALVIVSAPMVCGQSYILSLFLWGILLMGTFIKAKKS